MNKKIPNKYALIILIVVIIAIFIVGMVIIKRPGGIIGDTLTFYNSGNIASEDMKPINTSFDMGWALQSVKDNNIKKLKPVEDSKANELVNLRNYEGIEKRVASYVSDDEFTEIWLLKISKESDTIDLFRIFNERVSGIINSFANNEKIVQIAENSDNIVIKQQNGIIIVIISNNAKSIEKTIDEQF